MGKLGVSADTFTGLGPLEARVMEAAWDVRTWFTVNDVLEHRVFGQGKSLAYSTIKEILQRLTDKGHLRKRSAGRANEFNAVQGREQFERAALRDYVDPLLLAHRNPMLSHLADYLVDHEEAADELQRLVERRKAEAQQR